MKTIPLIALLAVFLGTLPLQADPDPRLSSWYTTDSGKYARIYQSTADQTAGTASTTWSRGTTAQSSPTYSGVSEVTYSSSWVYIRTTGLASHIMGPWYLDAAKSQNFPNFPSNTGTIYRIPRSPTVPGTKTLTSGGAIGYFVNGVAFFDNRDAFSYSNANGKDADPTANIGNGDGIWDRDAYVNELVSFDNALAHQAGNQYHYHVHPIALRYQLGDHVDYNSTSNTYSESTTTATKHSPIIAWASDGYPVYGPYGYSTASSATSGIRRMTSGYVLRNGTNGTTNLNSDGRVTLPAWAATAQGRSQMLTSNQYGPSVSTTYPLGHYLEDYDHLGSLGKTQDVDYDLDQYNGRTCVTPEFPGGTYAYFSTVDASGTPAFPYNIGRQFYGNPTGGAVTSITETVTTQLSGGPNKQETANTPTVSSGNVTVTWSAVQGGTYTVQASNDLSTWASLTPTVTASTDSASVVENNAATSHTQRYYKITRNTLAAFDSTGFNYTQTNVPPTVTTSAATGVGSTAATLNGTINANGTSTAASFDYGTTASYGSTVTASPATVTGSTSTSISASLTGLVSGTTYHFRARGVSTYGTMLGSDATFTASASGSGVAFPGGTVTRGNSYTLTITFPTTTTPMLPPANVAVSSVTVGGSATGISNLVHTSQYVVTCTYAVPTGSTPGTGVKDVVITFPGPPPYTMSGAITIN